MLKFITGNKTKFKEVQAVLWPIKISQINIDLPEIQEIDPRKIIAHKLREAFKHHTGEFFIDDSSLFLGCFDFQLPGPLIKWFNDALGTKKIALIAKKMGNTKAMAQTIIGYAKNPKHIKFFEGNLNGKIVAPKGKYKFGYDPIFVPKGSGQTLAQLKAKSDFLSSPRGIAVKKLKRFLLT